MTVTENNPYPIGYRRSGFPEIWGWGEVCAAAKRSDWSMRKYRDSFLNDWPGPVAVLNSTPVYAADEVREFLKNHPRLLPAALSDEEAARIYLMSDHGVSVPDIADVMERSKPTIYRYLAARKARPVSKGRKGK